MQSSHHGACPNSVRSAHVWASGEWFEAVQPGRIRADHPNIPQNLSSIANARIGVQTAHHNERLKVLKITVRDGNDIRIIVEGKLASAWVDELRKCCCNVLSRSHPRNVLVDLADVSFVDAAGKNLLAGLAQQGIRLTSDDAAMDALVSDIVRGSYSH
jgi:hypothetical protein